MQSNYGNAHVNVPKLDKLINNEHKLIKSTIVSYHFKRHVLMCQSFN